jgi:hypothetical protein
MSNTGEKPWEVSSPYLATRPQDRHNKPEINTVISDRSLNKDLLELGAGILNIPVTIKSTKA